ncbi:MAG: DUF6089 family protein [Bacteroidales bacterium]
MKYIWLPLFLGIMYTGSVEAQARLEAGAIAGVSYYNGDINPSQQLYRPAFAFGALFKYNLSKHFALRVSGNYLALSADDADFATPVAQLREASFSTNLIDFNIIFEYNFMPYTNFGYVKRNKERFAPYVFAGMGGYYLLNGETLSNPVSIPFGLGVKYNIFERFTLGTEWGFRKTFTDDLDGVRNIQDEQHVPTLHNTDWFSFVGVFLTYKLGEEHIACPAYE